jgi:hypothetical protein
MENFTLLTVIQKYFNRKWFGEKESFGRPTFGQPMLTLADSAIQKMAGRLEKAATAAEILDCRGIWVSTLNLREIGSLPPPLALEKILPVYESSLALYPSYVLFPRSTWKEQEQVLTRIGMNPSLILAGKIQTMTIHAVLANQPDLILLDGMDGHEKETP